MNTKQLDALAQFNEHVRSEMISGKKYYHFEQFIKLVDGEVTPFHRNLLADKQYQNESVSYYGEWYITMLFLRYMLLHLNGDKADMLYQALLNSATSEA